MFKLQSEQCFAKKFQAKDKKVCHLTACKGFVLLQEAVNIITQTIL